MPDDKLFNWYETKEMKKILPKEEPYPFEATQIKINSRILCTGSTGSGKTQGLLHYIRLSPNTFRRIVIFYKESEPLYELLEKKMKKGSIEFFTSLSELPTLTSFTKDDEPGDRTLLVIDDFMTELKNYKNANEYFVRGRKKGITLFLLSQNYFTIEKHIRSQITYNLFFTMTQKRDVDLILSEYDTEDKVLRKIYEDAISKNGGHGFLKIQTGNVPDPNKKFSSGFTDFYKIA